MEGKQQGKQRVRVVFFGGFYRGFYCLDELLHGRIKDNVKVIGVVTGFERGKVTEKTARGACSAFYLFGAKRIV